MYLSVYIVRYIFAGTKGEGTHAAKRAKSTARAPAQKDYLMTFNIDNPFNLSESIKVRYLRVPAHMTSPEVGFMYKMMCGRTVPEELCSRAAPEESVENEPMPEDGGMISSDSDEANSSDDELIDDSELESCSQPPKGAAATLGFQHRGGN